MIAGVSKGYRSQTRGSFLRAQPQERSPVRFARTIFALAGLVGSCLIGCGGAEQDRAQGIPGFGGASGDHEFFVTGPCEEGAREDCTATIHQANGVLSCFRGVQYCVDGSWSDCLSIEEEAPR